MTIDKIRGWLELFGIFGVIVSLAYVGIQIRQDQEIAKASMYQTRSEMLSQAMASAAGNSEAVAALAKAAYGDVGREILRDGVKTPLTAREYLLGLLQVRSIFALTDNSYYQYREGFLPPEHWSAVRATVKNFASENLSYRRVLESGPDEMSPDLRQEMEAIFAEIDRESAR